MKAPLLAAVVAIALTAVASAQTAPPLGITASTARAGRIDLTVTGPPGAQVAVAEGTKPIATVTLDAAGSARILRAGVWSCAQRQRTFTAAGGSPSATAATTVKTPSCAHRYRVVVAPRHPRATAPVRVRVTDTFDLKQRFRVCANGHCAATRRGVATLHLPAGRRRITAAGVTRTIRVRPPRHIRLLATGDSMIQIIDGDLKARLERVTVRSDAHISTGITKPSLLDWPAHAKRSEASWHPDVTIMFLGANDGFNFGTTGCCGRAWQKVYARKARGMMRTYATSGAVYWCLLPAPRGGDFRRVFVGVNAALRRAAKGLSGVHLLDLPKTFTPGYRFRQTITWGGRSVSVRQPDGVHLNIAGASIAATLMIRRMHRDGLV